jgi:DNA repair exonuclease SbcCD ATPase subunit
MPVGVPEGDVFAAADAVLARGERPTVERVRAELGRGSPARVGKVLEAWWEALAKRLAGEARLPALPAEVAHAFIDVWRAACASATTAAQQSLDAERRAVGEEVRMARQALADDEQRVAAAHAAAEDARSAQLHLEQRLAAVTALAETRANQSASLERDLESLRSELARVGKELADVQRAASAERHAAATERASLMAHIDAVENRAHAEVDRARQEAKGLKRELTVARQELSAAARSAQAATRSMHTAERRAAAAEARAQALASRIAARSTPPKASPPRRPATQKASKLRPFPKAARDP